MVAWSRFQIHYLYTMANITLLLEIIVSSHLIIQPIKTIKLPSNILFLGSLNKDKFLLTNLNKLDIHIANNKIKT